MRVRLKHQKLLDLIAQSKLSQNHWAMRLGLSRGHWSGIVNGKHPYPSRKTRTILLDAFGVGFDDLFSYESHGGVDSEFQAALAERYLLEKEIGQGGMGTVYLARDIRLARSVAIKVVATEAVSGIGAEQFLKEIRVTARLQHPHILAVHDAGEAAGAPYYVMPFVEGGSLRRRLELDGPLDPARTIRIVTGIAAALRHAHDRQILHCDVKPENVLLSGDHAYVADFGIARAIHAEVAEWGRRGELDSSAGTPAYVSPEQASGETMLDARSDVYSLACLTYELLSARTPFEGRNTMDTVAKRFVERPRLTRVAPHVAGGMADVIEAAMSINPADRPNSAYSFARALQQASAGEATTLWKRTMTPISRVSNRLARVIPGRSTIAARALDGLRRDVGFAFRTLKRSPLVAVVVMLTLALGIGINSAVFSVVNGVLLRPLPYPDDDQLVLLWNVVRRGSGLDTTTVNPMDFVDWERQSVSFAGMAAFNVWLPTISGDRGTEQVAAGVITPNFFDVVGLQPIVGTGFTEEHGVPGNGQVVLLSYGFWQRWFGGTPDILNRTLVVNGQSHDIVGVMPESYRHLDPSRDWGNAEFWSPYSLTANATDRSSWYLRAIARLAPGASITDAQSEMTGIGAQLAREYPVTNGDRSPLVVSLREHHYAGIRPALFAILGAAGLVLFIICANIANLVMARGQSRAREFAIRTSLGAGKARLARQLIIEQTALALPGAALGLAMVLLSSELLRVAQAQFLSRIAIIGLDWRVALFTVGLTLVVGVAFGSLSVLQLKWTSFRQLLGDGTAGAGSSRATHHFRTTLTVTQIALSVALLIAAGLLTRSFINMMGMPTGFDVGNTLTFSTTAPRWKYDARTDVVQFFAQLTTDFENIPGVEQVGMVTDLPFTSENRSRSINRAVNPYSVEDAPSIEYHQIDPGYLHAAGIQLVGGRSFTAADRWDAQPVVLVNETAAEFYWPGASAIGQQLVLSAEPTGPRATVVGIVGDILDDGFTGNPEPRVYFPYLQVDSTRIPFRMSFLVKSTIDREQLISAVRQRVRLADPEASLGELFTLEDLVRQSVAGDRLAVRLATWFSVLAVLLAGIGIYGLMAFVVSTRTREMGIRSALGAGSHDVVRLVVAQALRFTSIGIVLGLGLGAVVTRVIASRLFGVDPLDPVTFVATPLLLATIALVASYLPARRASHVAPMVALRTE